MSVHLAGTGKSLSLIRMQGYSRACTYEPSKGVGKSTLHLLDDIHNANVIFEAVVRPMLRYLIL
jgi:hypothetical protein